MNNDEIKYCQHILLFISHVEPRFSSRRGQRMYVYTVCQFISEVFIIRMKTDEF